ncbi:GNAT family N-acetyltransferase [Nitrospira sp. T9]|uniref:GNAT family N-acetyltransferase n=1 Tax=unclassified Nitrospira TaxID=2652172 RepID=UPI003F99DEBA
MKMKVSHQVTDDEWTARVRECSVATFFHTPQWYRCFAAPDSSTRVVVNKFTFDDGTTALLPMLEQAVMWGLHHIRYMGPAGCLGGWIAPAPLSRDQSLEIVKYARKHLGGTYWRINPYASDQQSIELTRVKTDSTEILRLSDFRDEESLMKNYRHSVRKQVKKGARAELKVLVADCWEQWQEYFDLYECVLANWGADATSRYPITLFRKLFEIGGNQVRLWLVVKNGLLLGGNVNFYHGRHCVEWHAAFDDRHLGLGTRNFLVHSIITHAMQEGYEIYDFNPSGGNEGTRRFKQNFGTTSLSANLAFHDEIPLYLDMLRNTYRGIRLMKSKFLGRLKFGVSEKT